MFIHLLFVLIVFYFVLSILIPSKSLRTQAYVTLTLGAVVMTLATFTAFLITYAQYDKEPIEFMLKDPTAGASFVSLYMETKLTLLGLLAVPSIAIVDILATLISFTVNSTTFLFSAIQAVGMFIVLTYSIVFRAGRGRYRFFL
jgi:hypothetical protein